MVTRTCSECGSTFQVPYPSSKGKTCSYKCRKARMSGSGKRKTRADKGVRKSNWVTLECAHCGKAFERSRHQTRRAQRLGWRSYCSPQCKDAQADSNTRGRPASNGGKGARYIEGGYVNIYVHPDERPPGWKQSTMLEHRYLMGKMLARHLDPHETVHHINGDRADNRPENLQLRNGRHGNGVALRCRSCGSQDIENTGLD